VCRKDGGVEEGPVGECELRSESDVVLPRNRDGTYEGSCEVYAYGSFVSTECEFWERIDADSTGVVMRPWQRHLKGSCLFRVSTTMRATKTTETRQIQTVLGSRQRDLRH
jgi:hypothetical protein